MERKVWIKRGGVKKMTKEEIKEKVLSKCPPRNCDRVVVGRIIDFTIYKTAKTILEEIENKLSVTDLEDELCVKVLKFEWDKLKEQFGVK